MNKFSTTLCKHVDGGADVSNAYQATEPVNKAPAPTAPSSTPNH